MDEVLLWIAIYACVLGLIAFVMLYAILTRPWRDKMGRHLLSFMISLMLAFMYGAFSIFIPETWIVWGWIVVLFNLATFIWITVLILIRYQVRERQR